MKKVSDEIAKFIFKTNFSDFSKETINYTKKLVLSNLGGMIAGSVQPAGKILSRYIQEEGGTPEAGVVNCRFRTSVTNAGLANGTFGHASELEDDSFPEACLMYNVIPAVLALGERLRASGKEVLEGVILGYEIQAKIALVCLASFERGHTGFGLGSLGPAAGAAKLLKLDTERVKMALSIASSMISGLLRQTGSMAHLFEAGVGARNGLLAALLAKDGFTGIPDIIEGPHGVCDYYSGGKHDLDKLVELLGEPFRVMEVGIKKYPCCYFQQRIIDGVMELKEKHHISYDEVETIEVHVAPYFVRTVRYADPIDADRARFSIEHSIAAVFLEKKVFLDTYTTEKALDPKFREARKRVKVVVDPKRPETIMAGADRVIIKLKNGKEYRKDCEKAKGDAPGYLTEEEVMDKFRGCAEFGQFLSEDQIKHVEQLVFGLERVKDVTRLMEIMTFAK